MVASPGLEPGRRQAPQDFKSCASTKFRHEATKY